MNYFTDDQLRQIIEQGDIVNELRRASEALVYAADEIVRLRGNEEMSNKLIELLTKEVVEFRVGTLL